MKTVWRMIFAVVLLAVSFYSVGAVMQMDGVCYYYPKPERQSAFIRDYSPKALIDSFKSEGFNSAVAGDEGSGAGRKFVSSEHKSELFFALQPEKRLPLMNALAHDLDAQLARYGASILSTSGDSIAGFHVTYRVGKNVGSVFIHPLVTNQMLNGNGPPSKQVPEMIATIEVSEKWFPQEAASIQASFEAQ